MFVYSCSFTIFVANVVSWPTCNLERVFFMKNIYLFKGLLFTLFLLCSNAVCAYTFEVNGIFYNILSATDLTCEVTSGNVKYSGKVEIPEVVTYKSRNIAVVSVSERAFKGCDELVSVSIGNSVKRIGNGAFSGCTALKDVNIKSGDNILSLGCNIYDNLGNGEGLFYDCPLETLYLGRNIEYETGYNYGYSPFYGIKTLNSVSVGNCVTSINNGAFSGCNALKSLFIEDGLETLSLGCNIYDGAGSGEGLFYDCPLETLYLGRNIEYETGYNYGYSPFYGIRTLSSVAIGNNVTSIGNSVFAGCENITSLNLNSETVRNWFSGITSIKEIIIGDKVTNISYNAFNGCTGFVSIYLMGDVPPSVGGGNFTDAQYVNIVLYVPDGKVKVYNTTDTWKNFWEIKELKKKDLKEKEKVGESA